MNQEHEKKNTTVAETVAEKFGKLDGGGRAYVLGYLMGKEDERSQTADTQEQEPKAE